MRMSLAGNSNHKEKELPRAKLGDVIVSKRQLFVALKRGENVPAGEGKHGLAKER
jgi:hypothetical protein